MAGKATVLIAYDFGDLSVETEVLTPLQAEIAKVSEPDLASGSAPVGVADALLVTTQTVDKTLLSRMPRCRIISRVGTGLDAIDLESATNLGIWVTSVPDYAVPEVSTHTIAVLLAHARQLFGAIDLSRNGVWQSTSLPRIERLQGQTLGLLGLGRIALAVAAKAKAFEMRVIAHDPLIDGSVFRLQGISSVSWFELLEMSDYLSLHVPLTSQTTRILDTTSLSRMKPTAVVINTARGGLIDEDALLKALTQNRLAGAALDVLELEPPQASNPLLKHPRVLVTPHMAWYSEASKRDVRIRAADEVVRVLAGRAPLSPVNRPPMPKQPL